MINLLPPIQKQELKDEQLRVKIIRMLVLAVLALTFFMAIVFILNFYGSSKSQSFLSAIIQKERVIKDPKFQESKQVIYNVNQNLYKIFQTRQEQVYSSLVLEKLSSIMPNAAYLTSFAFQNSVRDIVDPQTKETQRQFFGNVRIIGVSQTRETLFFFKKSLDQEPAFKEAYFAPASWINPVNAEFSAEFKFIP